MVEKKLNTLQQNTILYDVYVSICWPWKLKTIKTVCQNLDKERCFRFSIVESTCIWFNITLAVYQFIDIFSVLKVLFCLLHTNWQLLFDVWCVLWHASTLCHTVLLCRLRSMIKTSVECWRRYMQSTRASLRWNRRCWLEWLISLLARSLHYFKSAMYSF